MLPVDPNNADRWLSIAGRIVTPLGVLALLWLNTQYATKSELRQVQDDLRGVETAIKLLIEQNKVNDRQDSVLIDHENRLRELEKKQPK
jgi:hypothetical protein